MADQLFKQADLNKDQRLDLDEFRNLLRQNFSYGSGNYATNATGEGQYTGSSYESSTLGGYGGAAELAGETISGIGAGAGSEAGYNAYEQSSYTLGSGLNAGSYDANASAGIGIGGFNSNESSSFGIGGFEAGGASGIGLTSGNAGAFSSSTFETNTSQQQVQVDSDNPGNLFDDLNPQIIRRPAPGGQVTYTQNIKIRFLQPPPIPPPGPLIIKEVRPPQPPPPPPLRIRQQAPPLPAPPPLILRERPPVPPASIAAQTVVRRLAAIPVPPRSVIIERLPALPPKPRDIIIERWIPYAATAKRKTIVQRAEAAKEYPRPRNIIIQYEPVQVRVVRQFQRLGVTQENPTAYVQRYGISLLDAQTLIRQARAAGVVEDLSAPTNLTNITTGSSSFNTEFISANSGIETTGSDAGGSVSSLESLNYNRGQQGNASFSGFESGQGGSFNGGFSSPYDSYSLSSQGGNAAFAGAEFGGISASGYESYNVSVGGGGGGGGGGGFNSVDAAFNVADINTDGTIDRNEFRQFVDSHLQYRQ